jgi:hypothetical protein
MQNIFLGFVIIIYVVLAVLMCLQESHKRKINFFVALILSILITPFFAYFAIGLFPARNPKGCKWCGNKYNEAEFCGMCGKNELGELRK